MPIIGACLWVGLEYIRTHALTGFPWGILGYSQYSNQTLVQIADLTGVLGISFIIVLCNFAIAQLFMYLKPLPGLKMISRWKIVSILCYTMALVVAVLTYGNIRILAIDGLIQNGSKPKISVVQGNIRQDLKWDKTFKNQ